MTWTRTARRLPLLLAATLVAAVALPSAATAQRGYFGQNKIQYRDFDWHRLRGEHVDVYYYPAEEKIARVALSYAEESYVYLVQRFNHEVTTRIPLIIYASHSDFEQTNVLPFVPPEGILGVTEYLKRRVAVPFRGNYSEFRHTLRHELVHVFQLSMATQQFTLYPRGRRAGTPLWWSEGLAEYFSSPQDSRDEMIVRDLALSGRMPTISQLNLVYSAIVYPLGGELHRFLARRYGDWRINALYESLWKYQSFDLALAGVYGRSSAQLTQEWHYDLRQRYFPEVQGRKPLALGARELAELAVKPVAIRTDSSVEVAYLSPRSGYTNIYATPLEGTGKTRVVVKAERTPEFESLHAFSSRIDARDGVLIFASKYGDRDALFFWSMQKNKVVGRYQFDSLVSVSSPAWSPDGKRVAFSGLTFGGVADLYVLDTPSGKLTRVTDDHYEDTDPTWLPDGRTLVFSSDRAAGGEEGARNLFRIALEPPQVALEPGGPESAAGARQIMPLTSGRWLDESPRWDGDVGRIVFSSDRDGTFNLYSVDTLGNGRRETSVDGGVFDPAPVPGDRRVVVSGFADLSWSLFALLPDSAARAQSFALESPVDSSGTWVWGELNDARATNVQSARYERKFSLDFAAGGSTSAAGGYAAAQGAQLYFSDLLGDHTLAIGAAMYGSGDIGGMLDNFNADIFYLNQRRRLNWGLGVFRLAGVFLEGDFEQVYRERSGGAYGVLRYPLSRFTRVEGQSRLEYSNRDDYRNLLVTGAQQRRGVLASNFLSAVGDNTLWLETGPIDGTRWNLTGGVVSDVTHGVFENWVGIADLRKYLRTTQQSALAFRAFGYASEGTRPRATQIGGSWLLRGYQPWGSGAPAGNHAWVLNSEWRFPITNFVTVGFPFGAIRFPQVQGAFFGDLGQAWYGTDSHDPRVLGSAGLGLRTAIISGLVLRADIGRRYSFAGRTDEPYYRQRFVDFFFGYNY